MKRGLAGYAIAIYAFLHVPLLILAIFSVNACALHRMAGIFAALVPSHVRRSRSSGSGWEQLWQLPVASTAPSTVIGTLAAYALWKRASNWLAGGLYLSLVTPEIVTGVLLLALFQWAFRYVNFRLGMHTVILAHVSFSIAYVVAVVLARLRGFDPALEEAAQDLWARRNSRPSGSVTCCISRPPSSPPARC